MFEKDLTEIHSRADKLGDTYKKIEIEGMWKEITSMKAKLKDIMDKEIFSMGYGMGDCLYFGWTQEDLANMVKVKNALESGVMDLLAIIEKALNKKTEE